MSQQPLRKKLHIFEVLEKVERAKNKAEKTAILQEYNCIQLRTVLKGAFDDTIKFLLPEGTPPYDSPTNGQYLTLYRYVDQFKYFVSGGPGDGMHAYKREGKFIRMLSTVHPKDAEILIAMKDKNLHEVYKALTKKLVSDAFPNLIRK